MAHTRTAPPVAAHRARFTLLSLWFMPLALGLCMLLASGLARALDDPPGRVGRLANLQGQVSWFDHESGQWTEADRNRPLTTGDRVSTGANGRAELRVGSSVLRLAPATEVEVLRLDDDRMAWQLHSGTLALRLRTREAAQETELVTGEVRVQPERAGHYRFDRLDDTTLAGAWRGSLRVQEPGAAVVIETGQRIELWRESSRWSGAGAALRQRASRLTDDEFASWALAEDRQDERQTAYRYVSPEMTGAEDLDRHGRWEQHPEYGALWIPLVTVADWAPYRHGRWAWVQPWGWTWVDDARWGFAPFHYGRWVNWRGRWGWSPGAYVARPVFAPALVAWVGGPRLGVSIAIGLPAVAWVPLAPHEVFVPYYRHTPVYGGRVNVTLPQPGQPPFPGRGHGLPPPAHQPGPIMYSNQGVPGAVTVVPRDVLLQRQPVARAVVDVPLAPQRPGARAPMPAWETVAAPATDRPHAPAFERQERPERSDRRPWPERRDDRDPRDPRERREPVASPGFGAEPSRPAQGPAVLAPTQAPTQASTHAPTGAGTAPPERQPPQPPRQATPPLAPAVAAPEGPVSPRVQVPATEPQSPRDDGRGREGRGVDRRSPDMPRWAEGAQQPLPRVAEPAAPERQRSTDPTRAPAPPAAAPAPTIRSGPMPPPAPPLSVPQAAPQTAPVKSPAAPAPTAARPERPRDAASPDRPAAADRPSRSEPADPEEGRKRGPQNNRDRENLR